MPLTQQRLRSLLRYDPDQGKWFWIVRRNGVKSQEAGSIKKSGRQRSNQYRYIGIDGNVFRSARLAVFYMTGEWPDAVDHIDSVGLNDCWSNLRPCTKSQNAANSKLHRHNSSGFRGVSWHSASQTWRAYIELNGKRESLGYFNRKDDAALAYNFAALERFGKFAHFNVSEEAP